jgi:hypothetical protein
MARLWSDEVRRQDRDRRNRERAAAAAARRRRAARRKEWTSRPVRTGLLTLLGRR